VGFKDEIVTRLDPAGHRNVRVPAVVDLLVFGGGLVEVNLDEGGGHDKAPGPVVGRRYAVDASFDGSAAEGNTSDDVCARPDAMGPGGVWRSANKPAPSKGASCKEFCWSGSDGGTFRVRCP